MKGKLTKKVVLMFLPAFLSFLPLFLIVFLLFVSVLNADDVASASTGSGTSLTVDQIAQKGHVSKEQAENIKKILEYELTQEQFTLAGAAGSLAVAQRESGFDPKAINTGGGVAGYFQWSGWGSSVNGSRWSAAKEKKLDSDVELDLMSTELNGNWKGVKAEMQKASDPEKAALYWSEHYEGVSLSDGQTKADSLKSNAKKWYDLFNGTLTSQSVSSSNNDVVKTAESMKGYFYYIQNHPSSDLGNDLKNPNKSGGTDCSGFVWLTLYKAGYKVPANMGWFTGSMAADAKGAHHYLKEISQSEAKAGDIVIVNQGSGAGNNGHTAILLSKWKGNDTPIIQEGGDQSGHVNEGTFGVSFSILLKNGEVVLARPIK